jgi:anaerobic selenocysteine-containing dehydrogenase
MNAHAQAPGVRTTCPYCGVGCGVVATPDGAGGAAIAGDKSHPANFGRLCSKGAALGETLGLDVRSTATTESADLALTIEPGMDAVLFCGLLERYPL